MTKSNIEKAFFTLLRSGLWNRPVDDLACFPLGESEWKSLYNIAVAQTVEGIVYDGLQQLTAEMLPSRDLLLNWVVKISKIEHSNTVMNNCIKEQLSFFKKLNVIPILLKGQGLANYYPNKEHRVCGDIDWYFQKKDDNKKVLSALEANNVKIAQSTVESMNYRWRNCEVEHHTKLFDVFNPFARKRLNKISANILVDKIAGDTYVTLPANLNIIQVNLHILKHLLAFGIGIRQFCDSAVLYAKLDGDYDKEKLYSIYKEIGIINWIHVLHDMLVNYLGLSADKLPFALKPNSCSKWMVNDVLATGNFGFYDDKFSVRATNTIKRKNKSKKIMYSFKRYFFLAPFEALSFPIVHFVDRFKALSIG